MQNLHLFNVKHGNRYILLTLAARNALDPTQSLWCDPCSIY
ncbi:hypothetical protein UUU_13590 [Klebsiella pneumoniae subsp. pneumoniae DSM 30104 = JCM 1662 = NBRC 14940]|nr:hypothetical protein UUU_13590 [Klebsiella pneumoniae subsp. pneumoniae DSM 30104 = JCM 1662 = NBRC 14940]